MIVGVPRASAHVLTCLPQHLHHQGAPTAWTKMTRPGQDLHSFLEGPLVEQDGTLLLVDVPHGRILRVSSDFADWSLFYEYDGEPHGLARNASGDLIITDYRRGLLSLNAERSALRVLCDNYCGEAFRGLSDVASDQDGAIWFTDSGRTSLSDPRGRLFRLSPDGTLHCVLDTVPYPNGIAFSQDGAFAYVSATRANAVWRLARRPLGTSRAMAGTYIQLSGGLGPDGLAVSPDGILAVAQAQAGRVWLFDAIGDPLACILAPTGSWTTAVRFGGADGRLLIIVEAQAGALLAFDLNELGR